MKVVETSDERVILIEDIDDGQSLVTKVDNSFYISMEKRYARKRGSDGFESQTYFMFVNCLGENDRNEKVHAHTVEFDYYHHNLKDLAKFAIEEKNLSIEVFDTLLDAMMFIAKNSK